MAKTIGMTTTFREYLNGAIADALREPVGPNEAIDAVATAEELTAALLDCIAGSWELDDQIPVNAESIHDGVLRGIEKVLPGPVVIDLE